MKGTGGSMAYYKYIAKDISGKTVKGSTEAESMNEFYQKMHELSLFCIDVSESETDYMSVGSLTIGKARKIKLKDLTVFCRQFATMVNAGLTVIKCLDILYRQASKKFVKESYLLLYESIKKGNALSNALKEQGATYPQLLISMVESGETSGNLDRILLEMADHYEKERKQRNKMKSAMIYPIILICVCVIVVAVLLTFVMPQFFSLFDSMSSLPWATTVLIAISDSISSFWYIWILAIVGIVILWTCLLKTNAVRLSFDKFKLKVPIAGKLLRTIYTSRFARSVSSLYGSGIPIIEAIRIANNVIGNAYISQRISLVISDIRQGVPFSRSISNIGEFPPMFCSMVFIGEESGSLDDILAKTAAFYDDEADSAITRLVSLLEPCMIVIMGLIIGFIVIAIMIPMFSSYNYIA